GDRAQFVHHILWQRGKDAIEVVEQQHGAIVLIDYLAHQRQQTRRRRRILLQIEVEGQTALALDGSDHLAQQESQEIFARGRHAAVNAKGKHATAICKGGGTPRGEVLVAQGTL